MVRNCFGITLELSENKWRPEADLGKLWEENKDALLQLPLVATLGGEARVLNVCLAASQLAGAPVCYGAYSCGCSGFSQSTWVVACHGQSHVAAVGCMCMLFQLRL